MAAVSSADAEDDQFDSNTHCVELARRQNEQRKRGLFCDLTLSVGGRDFRAHRSVLAAATEYFEPLLGGNFEESRSERVEMRKWNSEPGPDPDTVEAVLQYMYTGAIRVCTGTVHEVLELADRYQNYKKAQFVFGNRSVSEKSSPPSVMGELLNCRSLQIST